MNNKNISTSKRGLELGINREATKRTNKALLIVYAAAQLALATGVPLNKNTNIQDEKFWRNLLKNTKEMLTADSVERQKNKNRPEADIDFIYPGNIVLSKNSDSINQTSSITIPYELAPHFDLAKATDTNDYKSFDNDIKAKLEQVIKEAIVSYGFVKDKYRENNTVDSSNLHVKIESITGNASPEAKKYGDSSLIPGNREQENIDLALEHRAQDAKQRVISAFQDAVSEYPEFASRVDTSSIRIVWDEPQLIESELARLDSLKSELGFPSIVEMIDANNKWLIKDNSIKILIDDLITSKRNIVVTFSLTWQEKNVYVIPLLLPLLLLIPRIRLIRKWKPVVIPPIPPRHEKIYVPREMGNKEYLNRKDRPRANKQPRDDRTAYFFTGWGSGKRKNNRKWNKKS